MNIYTCVIGGRANISVFAQVCTFLEKELANRTQTNFTAGYNMAATLKAAQNDNVLSQQDSNASSSSSPGAARIGGSETRRYVCTSCLRQAGVCSCVFWWARFLSGKCRHRKENMVIASCRSVSCFVSLRDVT